MTFSEWLTDAGNILSRQGYPTRMIDMSLQPWARRKANLKSS